MPSLGRTRTAHRSSDRRRSRRLLLSVSNQSACPLGVDKETDEAGVNDGVRGTGHPFEVSHSHPGRLKSVPGDPFFFEECLCNIHSCSELTNTLGSSCINEDLFKVKLSDSEVDEEVAQMGPNMPRLSLIWLIISPHRFKPTGHMQAKVKRFRSFCRTQA